MNPEPVGSVLAKNDLTSSLFAPNLPAIFWITTLGFDKGNWKKGMNMKFDFIWCHQIKVKILNLNIFFKHAVMMILDLSSLRKRRIG